MLKWIYSSLGIWVLCILLCILINNSIFTRVAFIVSDIVFLFFVVMAKNEEDKLEFEILKIKERIEMLEQFKGE